MSTLTRRRFIQISAAACAFPSCAQAAQPARWIGFAFGARVSINIYGTPEQTGKVFDKAVTQMRQMEKLFSIYDPDSMLSRLNQQGVLKSPPDEFLALLHHCSRVNHASGGLFDPTVQPVFEAKAKQIPYTIITAANSMGWNRVSFDENEVRFVDPRMALTFNGIAQGFVTDLVRRTLNEEGFDKTLVNIGEFSAGDRTATIGIADGDDNIFETVEIKNQAIATSSTGSYRFADGSSHILSPDGRNVEPLWETVSVIAPSAVLADGYSTALVLAPDTQLAKALKASGEIQHAYLKNRDGAVLKV